MVQIALSPCPNDTFLFHAWVSKVVGGHLSPHPVYADIEQLNKWALEGKFPLTKLSFHCFKQVTELYRLLPIGAALGKKCGPKIVSLTPSQLSDLSQMRVAIPGKETTANYLFDQLLGPCKEKVFCRYDEILFLLKNGLADCGLIIHETRFTFKEEGFHEITDLGELWEMRYHLPLPLGGLAVRRDLPDAQVDEIIDILGKSLAFARKNPLESQEFILKHSQEKDPLVISQHIQTYVNEETTFLSQEGIRAIQTLLGCNDFKKWLYFSRHEKADSFCSNK